VLTYCNVNQSLCTKTNTQVNRHKTVFSHTMQTIFQKTTSSTITWGSAHRWDMDWSAAEWLNVLGSYMQQPDSPLPPTSLYISSHLSDSYSNTENCMNNTKLSPNYKEIIILLMLMCQELFIIICITMSYRQRYDLLYCSKYDIYELMLIILSLLHWGINCSKKSTTLLANSTGRL